MKRLITYCLLLIMLVSACEDPYYPDIDSVENMLVVDARLVYEGNSNYIHLYKTVGFYEDESNSQQISGANISIVDDLGNSYQLVEIEPGIYDVDFSLSQDLSYSLKIEYGGNTYESTFESVPKVPVLDTVYGVVETHTFETGDGNNADEYRDVEGVQLYGDMTSNKEMPYYRFTSRVVMQYTYFITVITAGVEEEMTVYAWSSSYPSGAFNIASPPEYSTSTDIIKHPLNFTIKKPALSDGKNFAGWIVELDQYGITQSGHSYYDDINSQLDSDGRLFDPLYVQARSNLKCTNDPEQIVLGNFEIASSDKYLRKYCVLLVDAISKFPSIICSESLVHFKLLRA